MKTGTKDVLTVNAISRKTRNVSTYTEAKTDGFTTPVFQNAELDSWDRPSKMLMLYGYGNDDGEKQGKSHAIGVEKSNPDDLLNWIISLLSAPVDHILLITSVFRALGATNLRIIVD